MADIRVEHPRFKNRNLSVRPAGLLAAKLVLDGQVLKRQKGVYAAIDDAGVAAQVRLKTSIDPIPKVEIDGATMEIARALVWYEYLWAAWPFALVGIGGALGGLLGGGAAVANLQIVRKDWPAPVRYALAGAIGIAAVVAYVVVAALIHGATSSK